MPSARTTKGTSCTSWRWLIRRPCNHKIKSSAAGSVQAVVLLKRAKAPQGTFKAKHGVNEWEILRGRIQREPNPAQTVRSGQQLVVSYVSIVVPNETAVPHRLVSENRGDSQKQRQEEIVSLGAG